jgi:hypothetical protein
VGKFSAIGAAAGDKGCFSLPGGYELRHPRAGKGGESSILEMDMSASVDDLVNELPNPPQDLVSSEGLDLDTARRWVEWILLGVDRLNSRFFGDPGAPPLIRELVLQNAFLACVYSWHGRAEIGKASLVHAWIDSLSLAGLARFRALRERLGASRANFRGSSHVTRFGTSGCFQRGRLGAIAGGECRLAGPPNSP